jgi:sterol desaturase/sphingolipid hydroxylase (fatty acid hydroxylase superfamily)
MPNEAIVRFGVFAVLFITMAALEYLAPRRQLKPVRAKRWFTNWTIVILDSVLVRLLFKTAAVGGALWAAESGIGLFNLIEAPYWLAFAVSFLALDFTVWFSHLLSHKVPLFWRFHRMHHADVDIDVSTAIRFHPVEIIASMGVKYAVVLALGAPAAAVLMFEIVLNGGAMFNHANFRLPLWLDRWLRLVIVTPDMHRVHHSVIREEHNSNYGFNLSIWDRMFSTYVAQPEKGHDGMEIGLTPWQDERPTRLGWTLMIPFRKL